MTLFAYIGYIISMPLFIVETEFQQFVSQLCARKFISKHCIYHVQVNDSKQEAPTFGSILVLNEFLEVFLENLPGVPHEQEIDFGLDLFLDNRTILIPTNRMVPYELKMLMEQLKDLLEKGFIKPNASLWSALVLFMHKKDVSISMLL